MKMTPREIAANFKIMLQRERRHTANMVYAVRLAMGAKSQDLKAELDKLMSDAP